MTAVPDVIWGMSIAHASNAFGVKHGGCRFRPGRGGLWMVEMRG